VKPQPLLFVDSAAAMGGAEQSLLLLLTHLDRVQWQPQLACAAAPLAEKAAAVGIPVHPLTFPPLRRSWRFPADWIRHARTLSHLAQKTEAQALIANNIRAALYTAVAAKLARRPFIWHMRDFWLGESRPRHPQLDTLLKRLLCRAAAQIITNSHAVAAHLPCPNRISVVHNGLDLVHFTPPVPGAADFRGALGLPETAVLVGMTGRLRPWKGQRPFLEMARAVHARHTHARFVIIGGSPFGVQDGYEAELQEMVTRLGLRGLVHFTGHLPDVRPAVGALDIFVHPGAPEPFGLVNIEAMALGKPVVAFAHGALPEIVLPGETGLLVPPGDTAALATAVGSLITAPARRAALGRAGRQRAADHFSIQQTAAGVSTVLATVVRR